MGTDTKDAGYSKSDEHGDVAEPMLLCDWSIDEERRAKRK
jgi:hypothetical protein